MVIDIRCSVTLGRLLDQAFGDKEKEAEDLTKGGVGDELPA